MTLSSSFCKTSGGGFLVVFWFALCVTVARGSDDWITVKKVTRNPVFVTAGQTLKLRLDIENVDKWNTTAFWVYAKDSSRTSPEHDLQLMRDVDSSSETYFSYNKTRVSRERQVDLVVNSMTLADSGVYRCKFRKPDEEKGVISPIDLPPEIVYITRGDTLKLQSDLPDVTASSYGKNYETFWDFSPSLTTTTQEEAVRLIDSMDSSVESLDVRASLKENGTTLVLTNTTFNDSGVYHLRILGPLSTTAVHKDFNVIVEDKAIASIHCPSIVRLTEGENFFCLCEDISTSEVTAQASWLVDGQTFKHSRPFHEEELYLNNVTAADAGFYTCRVRTVTMVDDITLEALNKMPDLWNRVKGWLCGLEGDNRREPEAPIQMPGAQEIPAIPEPNGNHHPLPNTSTTSNGRIIMQEQTAMGQMNSLRQRKPVKETMPSNRDVHEQNF
ncbi:carcinoembryonic antigen-related cell adhesion molecule 1-like [Paramuricea clavata]|uniref:Carcinoembryonic antigen-related cell adhesion molecule 1-like n=1 Tax=Paramuricea clavata TaxID=317549 RepID=A0A7D9DDH3_PARCT|nr:carcinoembryonic antigen-related cell adhesion molecule 1-like [Paramuricea clavata]